MTDKDIEMWEVVIHMYKTIGYGDLLRWSRDEDSPLWIYTMIYDHLGIEISSYDLVKIYENLLILRAMVFVLKPKHHPDSGLLTAYHTFFQELQRDKK